MIRSNDDFDSLTEAWKKERKKKREDSGGGGVGKEKEIRAMNDNKMSIKRKKRGKDRTRWAM